MSQAETLLEHMRHGEVMTPLRALSLTGSLACHSRMNDIRAMGYTVNCKLVCNGRSRHGEYTIPAEQQYQRETA